MGHGLTLAHILRARDWHLLRRLVRSCALSISAVHSCHHCSVVQQRFRAPAQSLPHPTPDVEGTPRTFWRARSAVGATSRRREAAETLQDAARVPGEDKAEDGRCGGPMMVENGSVGPIEERTADCISRGGSRLVGRQTENGGVLKEGTRGTAGGPGRFDIEAKKVTTEVRACIHAHLRMPFKILKLA